MIGSKEMTIFQCNAPLEVIHAHLVRARHAREGGDWFVAYPSWVSRRAVRPEMWTAAIEVADSRPEYGRIASRIRNNLSLLNAGIAFRSYRRVHLVVSDLFWLMNNVLAAYLARLCRRQGSELELSILDEGAVLYTGQRLGIRRTLRCWAKFAYLALHGFRGLWLHPGNVDFLHPLCRRVYCLHPTLIHPPACVQVEQIGTGLVEQVYGERLERIALPPRSCLYLSQPLYKLVGAERQMAVVRGFQEHLRQEGIRHFYYKPHHADLPFWPQRLARECEMAPLEMREMLPIELLSSRCDADVLVSHSSSALLNVRAYGFRGRVVAYGLNQLRQSFQETSQLEDLIGALGRVGGIELLDAPATEVLKPSAPTAARHNEEPSLIVPRK